MNEDSIYRSSSQYRFWSFTPQTLTSLRLDTNRLATARILAGQAITAASRPTPSSSAAVTSPSSGNASEVEKNGTPKPDSSRPRLTALSKTVEPLTPSEELAVIKYYCEKISEIGDEFTPPLPSSVRATAIQYLHRFYLSQSPMTHPPLPIMKCALFFALKTDNYYLELDKFLLAPTLSGTTRSDILDLEYLLLRTLRYTMDVRHPFRGLEGGVMELRAIANGEGEAGPGSPLSAAELQRDLRRVEALPGAVKQPRDMAMRIGIAADKAKNLLKMAAALTDSYFLYTPSQIWLAALQVSDEPLFAFYINTKFPVDPSSQSLLSKVLKTISTCAQALQTYEPTSEAELKSLRSVGKRLKTIEKTLNVASAKGVKRHDEEGPLEGEETVKKKRRLEREKGEREGDVFGGPIKKETVNNGEGTGGDWSD